MVFLNVHFSFYLVGKDAMAQNSWVLNLNFSLQTLLVRLY